MSSATTPNDALQSWLRTQGIHAPREVSAALLEQHPSYPSILALRDVARELGCQAEGMAVGITSLKKLVPVLVALEDDFAVVESIEGETLRVLEPNVARLVDRSEFEPRFTGRVLIAEEGGESSWRARRDIAEHRRRVRWAFVGRSLIAAMTLGIVFLNRFDLLDAAYAALGCAGLLVCLSLISMSAKVETRLGSLFCPTRKRAGCQRVLSSRLAQLVPGLGLAQLGTMFFALQLAASLHLVPALSSGARWLSLLALLILPISLFYQAFVERAWCTLCLFVQAILLAQALIVMSELPPVPELDGVLALGVLGLLMGVLLSAEQRSNRSKVEELSRELARVSASPAVVDQELSKAEELEMPPLDGDIVVGNADSPFELGALLSLRCPACAEAFLTLGMYSQRHPKLRVRVRLSDAGSAVADGIRESAAQAPAEAWEHLEAWYREQTGSKLESSRQAKSSSTDTEIADWIACKKLDATPCFSVFGRRLPPRVRIEDLRYWLPSVLAAHG